MPSSIPSVAQYGEDLIVWDYFHRKAEGVFIEVGANDPKDLSMTWYLEQQGWHGLLVEPVPACAERLRSARPGSVVCPVAAGGPDQPGSVMLQIPDSDAWAYVSGVQPDRPAGKTVEVPLRTLESLCREHQLTTIDLLSIDVEGMERDVLRGLDLTRNRPALILVEDHLDNLDLYRFLRQHDYRLTKRTGCNNWWIPRGAPLVPETATERRRRWRDVWLKRGGRKLQHLFQRRQDGHPGR